MKTKYLINKIKYEASEANICLLEKITGWKPKYKIEKAISEIIDYEKNNPNKVYFRKPWFTYLFVAGLLFYIFTIIGTVVRVYYKDEEWAQFFISIGCLQDLFGR